MKKSITFVAAIAVLSIPLFAENKVGKLTGIQITDSEATISIAEGLINPFEENGFTKSGDISVTVPLDVAVEIHHPKMDNETSFTPKNRDDEKLRMPSLSLKQLKIDQLIQVVYSEDGKTVTKIQVQPDMHGPRHEMAACRPEKKDDGNSFRKDTDEDEDKSSRRRNMFMPNDTSSYR